MEHHKSKVQARSGCHIQIQSVSYQYSEIGLEPVGGSVRDAKGLTESSQQKRMVNGIKAVQQIDLGA